MPKTCALAFLNGQEVLYVQAWHSSSHATAKGCEQKFNREGSKVASICVRADDVDGEPTGDVTDTDFAYNEYGLPIAPWTLDDGVTNMAFLVAGTQ